MITNFEKPYKVNNRFYTGLIVILLLTLVLSVALDHCGSIVETISEITKNLAYGGIASTFVAWLIDKISVREKNEKAYSIYKAVFSELMSNMAAYIGFWAEMYKCSLPSGKGEKECLVKHTWVNWFELCSDSVLQKENKCAQQHLVDLIIDNLKHTVLLVNGSLNYIQSQYVILEVNGTINEKIRGIISNFRFEFGCFDLDLFIKGGPEELFRMLAIINNDIERYIWDWCDIRFFNYIQFLPYKLMDDDSDLMRAYEAAKTSPRPALLSEKEKCVSP